MDRIDMKGGVHYLLHNCKLSRGFEAQLVGLKVESCTTTALIIYVLSTLDELSSQDTHVVSDLLSFSKYLKEGARQFGTYHPSSWSTAQSLLALNSVQADELLIRETVKGLLKFQEENGSWTFSGKEDGSPFYAVYPVVSLLNSLRIKGQPDIASSLRKTAKYIYSCIPQSQTESLVLEYLRRKLKSYSAEFSEDDSFPISWIKLVTNEFNSLTVNEFTSSPFSMTFYGPSLYLFARKFIPPDHPFSFHCIKFIIESRRQDGVSWPLAKKEKSGRGCSFSTALALLTLHYWNLDRIKHPVSFDIFNPSVSSEMIITMLKNLSNLKKIFVSYSSKDLDKAEKIVIALKNIGCEVIFAEYDLLVGDSIPSFINVSLHSMEYFVICLSPSAVQSRYVKDEIDGAKAAEWNRQSKTILPVLLEECDIPPILAAKKYADFTANFDSGLSQLVRSI